MHLNLQKLFGICRNAITSARCTVQQRAIGRAQLYLSFLIVVTLSAGCGPIYETRYRYIAPQDQYGIACTNNCLMQRSNCKQSCNFEKMNCERLKDARAEADYYRAYSDYQMNKRLNQNLRPPERSAFTGYGCSSAACEELCNESHNMCYRNCGGQVMEYRECVAFCN